MKHLLTILLILSCGKKDVEPVPVEPADTDLLESKLAELKDEARSLMDGDGLVIQDQCDAPLWNGKLCAAMPEEVNLEVYEKDGEPGRFCRTKDCVCLKDDRSRSSWSGDMGLGAITCFFAQGNLEAIERHIAYGEKKQWLMGEGELGAIKYSPALSSLWYESAKKLGHNYGTLKVSRLYGRDEIEANLDDYQAHLQQLSIYMEGELDGAISDSMLVRINEHSKRLPGQSFYQAMADKWSRGFDRSIDLCLDDDHINGDYVRCSGQNCELVERIFVCDYILKSLKGGD